MSNPNLNNINISNNLNNPNTNNLLFNSNNVNTVNSNTNVILQTLKRRANKVVVPLDERVTLEKAYGFTITSNTRLTQSCDGIVAYLAGCVIVLYDTHKQTQSFLISQARKTLTTVAFSLDSKCLATGESGHDPKVRVWDVKEKIQILEFGGHKFSIECVYFSPNMNSNLLVSIGSMHDMVVNVWNLKSRFKVASNKIACKVKGISFSRDGSYFVTVGNRHVKFWSCVTSSSLMETVPLKGRAAILGDFKNNYFCDVVCGSEECSHLTFTITTNGMLCEFNENRCLSRAIDLRTERAYCLHADNSKLFVGCSNGTIHIFKQKNLEFLASLPRPHYLGVDIALGRDTRHVIENLKNPDLKYPDCVALCYDKYSSIISAVYNDHSFYVWDIKDLNKVKKLDSHLFHSSCCWALDIYSNMNQSNNATNHLPIDSFITCSTDNTLRIWSPLSKSSHFKTNIYSKELMKIIYIDNDLSGLCDIDQSLTTTQSSSSSDNQSDSQSNQQASSNALTNLANTENSASSGLKLGARCIRINPFGNHLAAGDRNGNIKIYDLENLEFVGTIEAHDCEILCLQYSQPESGRHLLASSSRDRLIHIFDASNSTYAPLQTIDDHSASITALRFCFNQFEKQLYLISCGNDKSIMFRTLCDQNPQSNSQTCSSSNTSSTSVSSSNLQFSRTSYVVEKQTFHDLNVDPTKNCINTISQDRMIRTYSIKDGKRLRQFRGSLNEDGYLLKMDTDRNGNLLATSCTDKCVYVWDLNTCECVAYLCGHSEVVTDLKFTSDNQHLITVGGDGCIFVWRLNNLVHNLSASTTCTTSATTTTASCQSTWSSRRANSIANSLATNMSMHQIPTCLIPPLNIAPQIDMIKSQQSLDTMFDIDNEGLPAWARNKLSGISKSNASSVTATSQSEISQTKVGLNEQPTARRGRAVWGPPVLNTSFAVMAENEMNSLSSGFDFSSISQTQETVLKEEQQTNELDELDFGVEKKCLVEFKIENEDENEIENLSNEIIQFPSPCVDKDYFHVKQVRLVNADLQTSRRMSWMGAASNEDVKCDQLNNNQEQDSQNNETDEDVLCLNESPSRNQDSGSKPMHASPNTATPRLSSTVLNPSNLTFRKENANESTIANLSPEFNSDFSKILNPISPSTKFSLLSQDLNQITPLGQNKLNHTNIIDSLIRLDCDMENSIRRQSLSARYLMKTQQQLHLQQTQLQTINSNSISSPITCLKSEVSSNEERNITKEPETVVANPMTEGSESNQATHGKTSPQFGISAAQMAADLIKLRRKSAILNTFTSSLSSSSSNNSQSTQQLYNHHTESSLNKTKPRSTNSMSSSQQSSDQVVGKQNFQNQLKRSPSVSSINNESRLSMNSKQANAAESSTAKVNLKSSSAKSSPNKQNVVLNQCAANQEDLNNSNLKKAVSMITLFTTQQQQQQQAAAAVVSSSKNQLKNSHQSQHSRSNQATATATSTAHAQSQANSANLLPPKTVRQIKQRSAERQLTSSSILTHTSNKQSSSSTTTTTTTTTTSATFIEQNKHLRRLSNSIQNINHQPINACSQHLLSTNLPPQAPRSSSKSPQFQISPSKLTKSNSAGLPQPQSKSKEIGSKNSRKMTVKLISASDLRLIEQQNKKMDSDQMSSSSSSSSQNSDFIIESNLISGNNNSDNDDNHVNTNLQSTQFQISSNSLTSSSSSSCSIFDNLMQTNNLIESTNNLEDEKAQKSDLNDFNETANTENGIKKHGSFKLNQDNLLNRSNEIEMSLNNSFNNNSSNTNLSPMSTSLSGFKKPITFASLAAANQSNQINMNSSSNSNNNSNNNINTSPTSNSSNNKQMHFSNDKIESILYEFKQNMFILDLIYNQVSKNMEELKKFQQTSVSLIQSSSCNSQTQQHSHQTIHLIQSFNSNINSIVKQFKTLITNSNNLNNNNSNNLPITSSNTDFEIA